VRESFKNNFVEGNNSKFEILTLHAFLKTSWKFAVSRPRLFKKNLHDASKKSVCLLFDEVFVTKFWDYPCRYTLENWGKFRLNITEELREHSLRPSDKYLKGTLEKILAKKFDDTQPRKFREIWLRYFGQISKKFPGIHQRKFRENFAETNLRIFRLNFVDTLPSKFRKILPRAHLINVQRFRCDDKKNISKKFDEAYKRKLRVTPKWSYFSKFCTEWVICLIVYFIYITHRSYKN
jgi:hypothetical protein